MYVGERVRIFSAVRLFTENFQQLRIIKGGSILWIVDWTIKMSFSHKNTNFLFNFIIEKFQPATVYDDMITFPNTFKKSKLNAMRNQYQKPKVFIQEALIVPF